MRRLEHIFQLGGGGKWDMAPKDTGVERRGPSRGKEGAPEDPGEALDFHT